MKTIYIKYHDPRNVIGDVEGVSEKEIKEYCFRAVKYDTEVKALDAYANTMCTWSTLLEEGTDVNKWIDDAWEHIKANDYEWLENNFT